MSEVEKETLEWAYKPFDVVTIESGAVGFIQEVNVNDSQLSPKHQISYAIKWLVGSETKHAWFDHDELTYHCNLFVAIAECSCHPMGRNEDYVQKLFNSINS